MIWRSNHNRTSQKIERWTDDVLRAKPRKITRKKEPSATLITDASDWGYGGILVDKHGTVHSHSMAWSAQDRASGTSKRSVHAEPEGIARLLRHFVGTERHMVVRVLSDSSTAVAAIGKGHSPAFVVNKICAQIQANFPNLELRLEHVAGVANPADAISRGKTLTAGDWAKALTLAQERESTKVVSGGVRTASGR